MATDPIPPEPLNDGDVLVTRAMRRDDLEPVLTNETRAYAFPWTLGMFEDCLNSQPPYDCRVGIRGGSIVAHGVLSVGAGEAHLLNVCVARHLQGRGFGRVMLSQLLRRAAFLGAEQMFLEVRPSNRVAVTLYESIGFSCIGVRKGYYPSELGREDAHVYGLYLTDASESV